MAVSRRLRYEVLRRDNFRCRYCGAVGPDAPLTVDHVTPVTLGGTDDPCNLAAACRDCNSGKSATPPDAPLVADVAGDALRWSRAMKEAQALHQVDRERRERTREQLAAWFADVWHDQFGSYVDFPTDPCQSLLQFSEAGLTAADFVDAVAVSARACRQDYWRYFCGICWARVRDLQETARAILAREEG